MVQTSVGVGKYLTKKWQTDREKAMRDKRDFTDEELAWLEVTDEPTIGTDNPDLYTGETTPVDTETESKPFDYRNDPVHPRK